MMYCSEIIILISLTSFTAAAEIDLSDWEIVTPASNARKPGLKARITQNGLDYATDVTEALLLHILHNVEIPHIEQSIAGVDLTMTNFNITSYPGLDLSLTSVPGIGLRVQANNIKLSISADYKVKFLVSTSGNVKLTARKLAFDIEFFLGRTHDGKPDLSVMKCTPGGELKIRFEGGMDTVLNMALSYAGKQIQSIILAQICSNAKKQINMISSRELAKLNMTYTILDKFSLDYSMVKYPVFYQDAFESFHRGELLYLENGVPQYPPFEASEMSVDSGHTERMVYVYVTDYVVNAASYAAFVGGMMKYNLTKENIPVEARRYLSTTCSLSLCLGTIFPQLASEYPGGEASLLVYAAEAPDVQFSDGKIKLTADVNLKIFITAEGKTADILTVRVNVRAGATLQFSNNNLTFTITELTPKAKIVETILNNPEGAEYLFDTLVRAATAELAATKLKELGERGVAVPDLGQVRLENTNLVFDMPHVLVVSSDVYYDGVHDIDISI